MSDTTGYMIAAYSLTLITIIGYAIIVLRGNRAALRRLEALGGGDSGPVDTPSATRPRPDDSQEAAHV